MKIYLSHINNTYNYGSMMMAENVITYLLKYITKEEIKFYTDCNTQKDIDRLKNATEYDKIYKDEIISWKAKSKLQKIRKILIKASYYKKASQYYDLIIILGGDDFSEFYMKGIFQKILTNKELIDLKKLNTNNNVILLGQTIGPYTGIRKKLAKRAFKNMKLYTRDDLNLKNMEIEYGIKAISSRDLAFLDLKRQKEYIDKKEQILKKYNIRENEYITIVGTQLINSYCEDKELFLNKFKEIIKNVQKKFPNKKILWLSHVTTNPPLNSDNTLLELLNKKYENFINKELIVIKEQILPVEARIVLGSSYFVISCRMHAAVSTFQMGKPAICLSYSPKYKGVISQGLHMDELVIEAKQEEFWQKNILEEVKKKVDYIVSNYERVREKIKENVRQCKEVADSTLLEIAKEAKKG